MGQVKTRESDAHIRDNEQIQVSVWIDLFYIQSKDETISVDNYVFVEPLLLRRNGLVKRELQIM
jgi:hypothetical protein